eukprot:4773492-Lingulodinium_polyedra.AAC.1
MRSRTTWASFLGGPTARASSFVANACNSRIVPITRSAKGCGPQKRPDKSAATALDTAAVVGQRGPPGMSQCVSSA